MNISLTGFGKMGKAIKNVCLEKGYKITSIVDPYAEGANCRLISQLDIKNTDCVIDFSHPSTIISNIDFYIENNICAVIGTTGWYNEIPNIKKRIKNNTKILYSGNFSIGVAMFLKVAERASKLMNTNPDYDVAINEFHHNMKADCPSGTALMIANVVKDNIKRKNKIIIGNPDGKIKENELQISSVRLGSTFGIHSLFFDSSEDTIEIKHTAKNRNGFAKGSVECAKWLYEGKKTGLLTFDDYLDDILNTALH